MADTEVFNQDETPQDLKQVDRNIEGALQSLANHVNAVKSPTSFGGTSGDDFSLLAEAGLAKKGGPAGFAATVHAEVGGSAQPDDFMKRRPGGKAERKMDALASQNDAMGTPKSYSQKKSDARELRKIQGGGGKKSMDPMNTGGSGGVALTGEKIKKNTRPFVTPEMIRRSAHAFGAGKLKNNQLSARYHDANPTTTAMIQGAVRGHDDARSNLTRQNPSDVIDRADKLEGTAKKNILEAILPKDEANLMTLEPAKKEEEEERRASPQQETKQEKEERRLLTMDDVKPPSLEKKPMPSLKKNPLISLMKAPL